MNNTHPKNPMYYAKILLFGEYGIIENSMGLSIPYDQYKGTFTFEKLEDYKDSNNSIKQFAEFLRAQNFEKILNLDLLESDITQGLSFHSNIPQGFGVGSSGALVAALYDRYAKNKIKPEDSENPEKISQLKQIFSQMENYFHGKSSGLDPLICYLKLPILIQNKKELNAVGLPVSNIEGKGAIFLINSQQKGETQPMVSIFLEKMKNKGFRKMLKDEFIKYNNACIDAFLNKNTSDFFGNLKNLSKLLLDNFKPMIPDKFHQLWQKGIESGDYYLKLCGSGGGGYILGFTADYEKTSKLLQPYPLELVAKL